MGRLPRFSFLVLLIVLPRGTLGTVRYVDASAVPGGDGSSWDRAFSTIAEAVNVAGDGDTVLVAPGIYREGRVRVPGSVTIQSVDPNDPNIVSATVIQDTAVEVVYVFDGFTIRGGGIRCGRLTVAIANNVIRDGAGIFCTDSSAVISGNRVLNNFKSWGGGIYCVNSSVTIANNVIVNNSAASCGGAINCDRSSPLIINNAIVGNVVHEGSLGLVGGIYADEESHPAIRNCILWGNGDELFNCSATYSCIEDADPGEGNIAFYPHFVDPATGDCRLRSWSPCIDAGDPTSPFSLEPEPNGGRTDMGAYGNTPSATSKTPDAGADGLPDDWEIFNFGHLDYNGTDDPGGDGILNIDEYRFGWDPGATTAAPVHNVTAGRRYRTMMAAMTMAASGDEIVAAPGYYQENVRFLGKALALRSTDPLDPATVGATVIDGAGIDNVVSFTMGEGRQSVLSGFRIACSKATTYTSGIFSLRSSPTISHNLIQGTDLGGAAVHCYGGSPLLKGNRVHKNLSGGGMYFEASSPVILENVISGNSDKKAGGICLVDCASATIERNEIRGNWAWYGGGLFIDAQHVRIANNLIFANRAVERGAIYIVRGEVTILNCTIVSNSVERWGHGGIYSELGSGTTVVKNCILWANGDDLYGVEASHSCIEDEDPGEGNIHDDPRFTDPDQRDLLLKPTSPCINAANTGAALNVAVSYPEAGALISWAMGEDLDGNPRISGRAVDMGAYEYQEGPPTLSFLVQHSSDLLTWESVEVGPFWQWLDDIPDGLGKRFYRIGVLGAVPVLSPRSPRFR